MFDSAQFPDLLPLSRHFSASVSSILCLFPSPTIHEVVDSPWPPTKGGGGGSASRPQLLGSDSIPVLKQTSDFINQVPFHSNQTRMLEEENSQLTYMLNKLEMMDGDIRDQMEPQGGGMCDNNPPERDYNYQIPFGFRVQPMQPNLQDRM